jgi:D-alanyl-D-alanine carboxypeptidase/D-alanyl-D-alanine-endopeptidase (penicillin-binding protein 4)
VPHFPRICVRAWSRRRAAIALAACTVGAVAATALASADAPLRPGLAAALRAPGIDPSRTGAVAVDLASGHLAFAFHADRSLVPASNEKLPLTYAALIALGPSFRIRTEVRGVGQLVGAVWRGRLILEGEGDPTLSSGDLRRLAERLRARGIRRVTGPIVGDESYFDSRRRAPGWKPSFYGHESPPLSALVVDRGRVRIGFARRPALVAAQLFRRALRASGIRTQGPAKAGAGSGEPLTSVASSPLHAVLQVMDRDSDNFRAEELLKVLGAVVAGHGTTAGGAAVVRQVLVQRGIPRAGIRIADGSGLSSLDRLTPASIAAILVDAWRDPAIRPYFAGALAVAGRNGTLRHRLLRPPARGRVRGKTGTTDLASALSGYVRNRYAFVAIENGNPVPWWAAEAAQDRFVEALAAASP